MPALMGSCTYLQKQTDIQMEGAQWLDKYSIASCMPPDTEHERVFHTGRTT